MLIGYISTNLQRWQQNFRPFKGCWPGTSNQSVSALNFTVSVFITLSLPSTVFHHDIWQFHLASPS